MIVPYILIIGVFAGILAGIFGVGGGLVIVPALVFIAGYSQATASGVSLVALLAPVGLGGVYAFYQAGKIGVPEIKTGLLISVGMFFGSYLGAKLALGISDVMLKRGFCIFLLVVATKLWMQTMVKVPTP
jgi:uncharacterized membrane protein YfcA